MARTDKSTGNYATYTQLVEAIHVLKQHNTMREISDVVGVAPGTVSNIVNRNLLQEAPLKLDDYWIVREESNDGVHGESDPDCNNNSLPTLN
jgi:hypothetical protein